MENWDERHKKLLAILDEDEGAFDDGDDDDQGGNKEFYRLLKKGGDEDETEEIIEEYRDVLDGLDDIEDGLTEEFEEKIRDYGAVSPEEVDELLKVDYYKIPQTEIKKMESGISNRKKYNIYGSINNAKRGTVKLPVSNGNLFYKLNSKGTKNYFIRKNMSKETFMELLPHPTTPDGAEDSEEDSDENEEVKDTDEEGKVFLATLLNKATNHEELLEKIAPLGHTPGAVPAKETYITDEQAKDYLKMQGEINTALFTFLDNLKKRLEEEKKTVLENDPILRRLLDWQEFIRKLDDLHIDKVIGVYTDELEAIDKLIQQRIAEQTTKAGEKEIEEIITALSEENASLLILKKTCEGITKDNSDLKKKLEDESAKVKQLESDKAKLISDLEKVKAEANAKVAEVAKAEVEKVSKAKDSEAEAKVEEVKEKAKEEIKAKVEEVKAEAEAKVEEVKAEAEAKVEEVKEEAKAEVEKVKGEAEAKVEEAKAKVEEVKKDAEKIIKSKEAEVEAKVEAVKSDAEKEIKAKVEAVEEKAQEVIKAKDAEVEAKVEAVKSDAEKIIKAKVEAVEEKAQEVIKSKDAEVEEKVEAVKLDAEKEIKAKVEAEAKKVRQAESKVQEVTKEKEAEILAVKAEAEAKVQEVTKEKEAKEAEVLAVKAEVDQVKVAAEAKVGDAEAKIDNLEAVVEKDKVEIKILTEENKASKKAAEDLEEALRLKEVEAKRIEDKAVADKAIADKALEDRALAEEKLRLENEALRLKVEADKAAEESRLKLEAEAKAQAEQLRLDNERKAKESRQKLEEDRAAEQLRLKQEAERAAEESRLKLEAEKASAERIAAEELRLKLEAEKAAEELRLKLEAEKAAEELRLKVEAEKAAEELRLKVEAEKAAEELRFRQAAEELRLKVEAEKAAEELRLKVEAEKAAEELRLKLEADKAAEESRLKQEAEIKAAAEKKAAEDKIAADKKAAEDKIAADKKAAEDKIAADKKAAEDKVAADKKAAEDKVAADKKAIEDKKKQLENKHNTGIKTEGTEYTSRTIIEETNFGSFPSLLSKISADIVSDGATKENETILINMFKSVKKYYDLCKSDLLVKFITLLSFTGTRSEKGEEIIPDFYKNFQERYSDYDKSIHHSFFIKEADYPTLLGDKKIKQLLERDTYIYRKLPKNSDDATGSKVIFIYQLVKQLNDNILYYVTNINQMLEMIKLIKAIAMGENNDGKNTNLSAIIDLYNELKANSEKLNITYNEVVKEYKKISTFVKYRRDTPLPNPRYDVKKSPDNVLMIEYTNIDGPIGYDEDNKYNYNTARSTIDVKPKEYYFLGTYDGVYNSDITASKIASTPEVSYLLNRLVDKKENVVIIGYGQSGSGKTSTLVYLKNKNVDGILMELCKLPSFTTAFDTIVLECINIYTYHWIKRDVYTDYKDFEYKTNPILINEKTSITFKFEPSPSDKNVKNWFSNDDKKTLAQCILAAFENREEESTPNNPNSSRSHVLCCLKMTKDGGSERKIVICDLAGVENVFQYNLDEIKKFDLRYHESDKYGPGEKGKEINFDRYFCDQPKLDEANFYDEPDKSNFTISGKYGDYKGEKEVKAFNSDLAKVKAFAATIDVDGGYSSDGLSSSGSSSVSSYSSLSSSSDCSSVSSCSTSSYSSESEESGDDDGENDNESGDDDSEKEKDLNEYYNLSLSNLEDGACVKRTDSFAGCRERLSWEWIGEASTIEELVTNIQKAYDDIIPQARYLKNMVVMYEKLIKGGFPHKDKSILQSIVIFEKQYYVVIVGDDINEVTKIELYATRFSTSSRGNFKKGAKEKSAEFVSPVSCVSLEDYIKYQQNDTVLLFVAVQIHIKLKYFAGKKLTAINDLTNYYDLVASTLNKPNSAYLKEIGGLLDTLKTEHSNIINEYKKIFCEKHRLNKLLFNIRLRINEGMMINHSLEKLRNDVKHLIMNSIKIDGKYLPLIYDNPVVPMIRNMYMEDEYYDYFLEKGEKKDEHVYGKIMEIIGETFKLNLSQTYLSVFTVINLTDSKFKPVNNPPNPPYINISHLIYLLPLKYGGMQSELKREEILKCYKKLLDTAKIYKFYFTGEKCPDDKDAPKNTIACFLQGFDMINDSSTDFDSVIYTSHIKPFINLISSNNPSTLIGSLESTDVFKNITLSKAVSWYDEEVIEKVFNTYKGLEYSKNSSTDKGILKPVTIIEDLSK